MFAIQLVTTESSQNLLGCSKKPMQKLPVAGTFIYFLNIYGKRPLERPRCRWIDNIKMDLLEIGVNVVD
jgi:hypothetical protein